MLLQKQPLRFSELKRGVDGISQRMLTLTLRHLERDGLVTRAVTTSIPPRVDYELTELGHSLAGPIQTVGAWAFDHLPQIEEAQALYDTKV
nr:helix-turn-helix domain-containing protein [Altericroceibacterium spongiae]